MNISQREIRLPILHEFKLWHNTSETSANINRAWGDGSTNDGQYEGGSRNSVVEMRALKMKKVEVGHAVLTMNNCRHLLSKIHVKVSGEWLRHLLSALQQFHAIYRALER